MNRIEDAKGELLEILKIGGLVRELAGEWSNRNNLRYQVALYRKWFIEIEKHARAGLAHLDL